jgi:hypothetical protein
MIVILAGVALMVTTPRKTQRTSTNSKIKS